MVERISLSRKLFLGGTYGLLSLLSLLCMMPIIHILAVSFSGSAPATAGLVKFWPVQFTLSSYEYVLNKPEFFRAFGVSLQRIGLGVTLNIFLAIIIAYPLSKEVTIFKARTVYTWIFVFTMLFSGGLIPTFLTIKATGLLDTIWALVIPGAVPIFLVILLLNFFRGIPRELEEAAFMDGAGHWITLWRIFVPLSLPSLATITLFSTVNHWNAWFDGFIYMNRPEHMPLQTYLRSVVIDRDTTLQNLPELQEVTDRTSIAAQVFLGALPILLVYPFLQRFFIKGMVLGSVKG
ncbi:MAG: transporter permease [Paenibacillaceae bacterium]|jgi:putative aldouronate transport system permease protein|nr:transporter permease [Paenibacillaceae bacterium]